MTKTDEVLALARRLLALEADMAAARAELDALVGARDRQVSVQGPTRASSKAPRQREAAGAAGVDVQGVVLQLVLAEPTRSFRAGDLRALLPGHAGKNSVESALQRLLRAGQLERAGRGLYRAARGAERP